MRDLLWRCDEHRGPDADFPALRGKQNRRGASEAFRIPKWKQRSGGGVECPRTFL